MGLVRDKMKEKNKRKSEKIINNEDRGKNKKSYFGALKGIGSFTEEDRLKGQLEE